MLDRVNAVRTTSASLLPWKHSPLPSCYPLGRTHMITSVHTRPASLGLLVALLTACGAREFHGPATVRDSAGVSIIESSQPRWTDVAGREIFISTENGRAVMSTPLFARNSSAVIRDAAVFVGDQVTLVHHGWMDGSGRYVFVSPWEEVVLVGTTDDFSDEIDEPVVRIEEVHYLLSAVNEAFPRACLNTNDLRSVFAGVRPLAASPGDERPPSSVSREDRIYRDPSGLISVAGGKLTTYRAMGEAIVDRAVRRLPAARRGGLGPSRTANLPLRSDGDLDRASFEAQLCERFQIQPNQSAHLVRTYGARALDLLEEARPEEHRPIGASRNTLAEIAWSFRTECPVTLCDLLERRLRMAIFAVGQGLPELPLIARTAAAAAGWDEERAQSEARAYNDAVRRRYQIVASAAARSAA